MSGPRNLAVDPSSPDAHVGDHFVQRGEAQEMHPGEEGPFDDAYSRRQHALRWAMAATLGALCIIAVVVQIASSSAEDATPESTAASVPAATVGSIAANPLPGVAAPTVAQVATTAPAAPTAPVVASAL